MKKSLAFIIIPAVLALSVTAFFMRMHPHHRKLLWFIPDGVRGDWVFTLAEEGYLPNIKKMMDTGVYAFSRPAFPSHTPVNFATLRTGCYPDVHGVSDGPIRLPGTSLMKPIPGFSALASRTPAIWDILDKNNRKVIVFSVPGSTPPNLVHGITLRGRWAGWGVETPPLVFTTDRIEGNVTSMAGATLSKHIEPEKAGSWRQAPESFDAAPKEIDLTCYGTGFYGYIFDGTNDGTKTYDTVAFSQDKTKMLAAVKAGQWSEWVPVRLQQKPGDLDTYVKIKVIKLSGDGNDVRIRFYFNSMNRLLVEPSDVYAGLMAGAGPSVDFVDDWPHQLVEDGDYETFKEEASMSFEWHKKAASFLLRKYRPDALIQTVYTTNQLLEAPFWMGHVDPTNKRVFSGAERSKYWNDIVDSYRQMDDIVGEYLKRADADTVVVFSSDHGIAPLHRMVRLNNLFAKNGWLTYTIDAKTGRPVIDWRKTKVVFLKMAYIYISPDGFGDGGFWQRASGERYESLRDKVIRAVAALEDTDGGKPLHFAKKWEEADSLRLPKDRIGDIILSANPPYAWTEDIDAGRTVFVDSRDTGYKQTVDPNDPAILTPFIITGPGVKKGGRIEQIDHVDQMPTLLALLGIEVPKHVQGKVLANVLSGNGK